ncbi:uncharacterized protein LOC131163432 [Malania oleifera]|uniref:uncharacterized protein LOC131163432 n=1 Tax=Malania oleifera TaxID=397392 RepID=UPI0025AE2602|nr:uncharacterized protein LOC131163432 [Malania oleifera]
MFDLNIWNIALLSKTLWNIHSKKDSIWTKWIHHMYLTDSSIWSISATKNDFPLFKKLLTIRDQLVVNCGGIDAAIDMLSKWENRGKLSYEFWRAKGHKVPWTREVWYEGILPKHSICLWLGLKAKLLACDKLTNEGIDRLCTFCNTDPESLDHLFFKCKFTAEV